VKGLTWQIAADGAVRFRTERGEFPIWLDAEQAEQLGRDFRANQRDDDPDYLPWPHASNHGDITEMPAPKPRRRPFDVPTPYRV
jgi:hypothetical protein